MMRNKFCLVFISIILAHLSVARATPSTPLELDDVLESSAAHFPAVLESIARRNAAVGDQVAARGAFDTIFSSEGFARTTGSWDGRVLESQVKKNLRPFGANVYGGYRIADGAFPVYEDEHFTNRGGEIKIGVVFSLLRDRAIDQRRFNENSADLDVQKAQLDLTFTRVGVQHRAQRTYWQWVAAGHKLQIYEDLLNIAKERQRGLEEEVALGARAPIYLTENNQNITRREILIAEATRDFAMASNALSLYYRDDSGAMTVPTLEQVPSLLIDNNTIIGNAHFDDSTMDALRARPELQQIDVELERARQILSLGRNQSQPRLDLRAELSTDLGGIGEGGASRDSTDTVIGLRFSIPFEQRNARGAMIKARSKIEALKQRQRLVGDQIEVEIRRILFDLSAGQTLSLLAAREVQQADIMQKAERERFRNGASDFFLVNLREEAAADARVKYILAALEARTAQTDFDAATLNLERLRLIAINEARDQWRSAP